MTSNLIKRLSALEAKQPKNLTCYPIDWFYGRAVQPEPLIPGLSLAAFYQQHNKGLHHAHTQK